MSYEIKRRATNGMLFIEFEDKEGKRQRKSLGTRDEAVAKVKARELYIAHMTGEVEQKAETASSSRPDAFTLEMAFEKMKQKEWSKERIASWESVWSDCRKICEKIGHIDVRDITYTVLDQYETDCRKEGQTTGTIKKRLGRISRVLRMCSTKWDNPKTGLPWLRYLPAFPEVGEPKPRTRVLSEDEERRVLEYCDQQGQATKRGQNWWLFKCFIIWLLDTGMRKNEALRVTLADIRSDVVYLRQGETKNDDPRGVPLTLRLKEMVKVFQAMGLKGPIFGTTLTEGKVFEMWNDVRKGTGIEKITIHDLRRTRGTRLALAGVPLDQVARLLGHRNPAITFKTYQHLQPQDLVQWVEHAEQAKPALRLVSGEN